jgi:hypothetical protein
MKTLLLCLLILTGLPAWAQRSAFVLPKPAGWGREEFALPPGFAPAIPYKGEEDIRFSPGWGDTASANYWAYVFLWHVQGTHNPSADTLRRYLIAYYNGLYLANKQGQPPAGYGPEFTQVRVSPNKPWPGDDASYTAKAYTYDYMTGRQLDLLIRIHIRRRKDGQRTALLFEVSPKPYDHAVWKELKGIVDGFSMQGQPAK